MKTLKSILRPVLLLLLCGAFVADAGAQDVSRFFTDTNGAFVLYDQARGRFVRYNEQRCRERFSPKSTFKIPNSLIGLDSGVIKDAEFVIPWNKEKYPASEWGTGYPFEFWARDHTLRTAIKYSVVWYYRELAQRVGLRDMRRYVAAFRYGNLRVSQADGFWLDNSLRISADEQVEFLRRFYANKLPVSRRSVEIVKDILMLEQTPGYKLSAKTGGGQTAGGKYIGWFVGYVETKKNVAFFALNLEGADYAAIRDRRIAVTKQILAELGYLPGR